MNPSEKQICASPDLMRLDLEMGEAYRRAEPHMPDIKKVQKEFRRGLKSCKGDDACLTRSYEARNGELRAFIYTLPRPTEEEIQTLTAASDQAEEKRAPMPVPEVPESEPPPPKVEVQPPRPAASEVAAPAVEAPVAPPQDAPKLDADNGLPWWAYVVAAILVILMWLGFMSWLSEVLDRCPTCRRWMAGEVVDSESKAYTDFKTVDRVAVYKNQRQEQTGSKHYKVQEKVRMIRTKRHLVCKYCRASWTSTSRREA